MLKKKSPKCLIVGLDGVPFSLLNSYVDKGFLPHIERILGQGYSLNQMDASIPDVSSVSWATFMTGVNPGEHGIYGFMELNSDSYSLYFPNSQNIKAPTFWDILGRKSHDKDSSLHRKFVNRLSRPYKSLVLNVPQTYPAYPINGILVAGFVALELKKACYPESAYKFLNSINYEIDVDSRKAKEQKNVFIQELFRVFEKRKSAFHHFLNEQWDLCITTITETDRLHHFFYDAAEDESHSYHKDFVAFYADIDSFIGKVFDIFMEQTDGNGLFMILSDHGFTVLEQEVYLNYWLKENGFLKVDEKSKFFEKIDNGTQVFAMDPARIYINTVDRYPRGMVKKSDKQSIIKDAKDALCSLKDAKGKRVVREIYDAQEIYSGPLSNRAPDLVCLPNDGFDFKSTLQKQQVFGKEHFTGMHTHYDAHCILPGQFQPPSKLQIQDLAGIVLEWFC